MSDKKYAIPEEKKGTAEKRKADHISLSFESQSNQLEWNDRFDYEPMLAGFPTETDIVFDFLSKKMSHPLWISSMTGGSELAKTINYNLAKATGEYGLGMGLGSCRSLLYSNEFFEDFNVRSLIGDQPMYANLGIAQVSFLISQNQVSKITELVNKLQADGLIVHVNPIQEYMQPEGDRLLESPIETIKKLLDQVTVPIIVKEVGQGMGPESLRALLSLPIQAIEFAAYGGTNFAKLEQLRSDPNSSYDPLCFVGHTAEEMVLMVNDLTQESTHNIQCKQLIISGGIKDYLDGYYLTEQSQLSAVYGQAGAFLKHARGSYEDLQQYVEQQINGRRMAKAYLRVKKK